MNNRKPHQRATLLQFPTRAESPAATVHDGVDAMLANVRYDRTFEQRLSRSQVEREAQLMFEADQRESALVRLFRKLPTDKQSDVVAIAEVYYQEHGIDA